MMPRRDTEGTGQSAWPEKVKALEEEGRRAFLARDVERLDALWSDQLIVNSPINRVHDKKRILELLRAGTIAHSSMEIQIETMERYGDLVIVMGGDSVTNSPGGPVIRRRFTNVWRVEGGSFLLIVRHANVIAQATGAP